MKTAKWWCVVLVAALAWASLLAPLTAMAQMQTPPPAPPPGLILSPPYQPTQGDQVGAAVLNIVYVPGKAILCGSGTLAGGLIMLLTFGSGYRAAVQIFNEGCAGKWALTPYDVAGKRMSDEQSY